MLHQFYAVTLTSIYLVGDKKENSPYPFAQKIALKGESGIPVGNELENGTMIAIAKQLQAYIPEGGGLTSFERRLEMVNTRYWGGHSSYIVALFKTEKEAEECLGQDNLQPCDNRWVEKTKEIIEEIGENHPAFEVCRWHDLALLES